jgi:hypothetical protein
VLLEQVLLLIGKLPVVADVAAGDRRLDNVRLIESLISGIWHKSIGRSMKINYPVGNFSNSKFKRLRLSPASE